MANKVSQCPDRIPLFAWIALDIEKQDDIFHKSVGGWKESDAPVLFVDLEAPEEA